MELELRDGDYVPDGQGGLTAAEGEAALLQRVLFLLTARRGSFPFLPELGSRLHRLPRERPSAREALALQWCAEALRGEKDLAVTGVELSDAGAGAMGLRVLLDWRGRALEAEVRVS